MGYKPVQNESAHLTDKPGRSAFPVKSKGHAPKRMKKPMKLEKGRENKTRS